MSQSDRRTAIRIALGAALMPVLASRSAWASEGAHAISPPNVPMIYTRRLERYLPGDACFMVTRDFLVHFAPAADGFQLIGAQVSAAVVAPENLAQFAQLEEQRVETGLFPLHIDRNGQITEGEVLPPGAEVESAMQFINDVILSAAGNDSENDELAPLIRAVHQAGAGMTTQLPQDLFAPTTEERRDQRDIALPWGNTGSVRTVFSAERDPNTGLMRAASREIVTQLAGDSRRTLESWTLQAR